MLFVYYYVFWFFFFKQKTAYEMRISDWSSDVCSSDLRKLPDTAQLQPKLRQRRASDGGQQCQSLSGRPGMGDEYRRQPDVQRHDADRYGEIGRAACRERVCQYV